MKSSSISHALTTVLFFTVLSLLLSPGLAYTQIVAEPSLLLIGRDNLPQNGTPISETLFFFDQSKGALRAGELIISNDWSPDSLGRASIALGYNTRASGNNGATALGYYTRASGSPGATALGRSTVASGNTGATALGHSSVASGDFGATALGRSTVASGNTGATALGYLTLASGNTGATALGYYTTASGDQSVAIGSYTTASGDQSVAIGSYVSTNNRIGAFFFGDASVTAVRNSATDNQFVCRFANGYYFITGESGGDKGVRINANGNAWSSICDSTRKENFLPLSGRIVLERIDQIPMRSWNYKGVDPTQDRHYGIMAQEFYNAFGRDEIGTIGNDTLVNPIDMLGIAYAAIKELHSENKVLTQKTERLEKQNEQLQQQMQAILRRMDQFEQLVVVKAEE